MLYWLDYKIESIGNYFPVFQNTVVRDLNVRFLTYQASVLTIHQISPPILFTNDRGSCSQTIIHQNSLSKMSVADVAGCWDSSCVRPGVLPARKPWGLSTVLLLGSSRSSLLQYAHPTWKAEASSIKCRKYTIGLYVEYLIVRYYSKSWPTSWEFPWNKAKSPRRCVAVQSLKKQGWLSSAAVY